MNKYRILVVEDEALIAASLVHALSSLGYTVLEPVATGEDAIRAVKTQKPDLVLMDIVLIGEMDGIVAAEKIRAIAEIPIVYLTAYTDDLRLKQAMLTEPYGYIVKPAFTRELNATIEMAMYKHALDRKLKESEETFKALAENANDGILVAVAGGVHIYANRRAGEITGYSVAELLKTCIKDLAAPDEVKKLIEKFRKRLSGEDIPHQYETIIIRKDGKSVPIEFSAAKTSWHGQPADLVIIRDITERKRAEEALQQSETKYRTLVETLNEGIWVIDREAVTTFVNPKMAEILGYTIEEMAGRSLFSFMDDEGKRICERLIERRQRGIKEQLVFEFLKKDGTRIYVSLETGPIKGKDGEYLGAIAGVIDITERKRMEEALRESEAKYRLIADNTADNIWIFDMDLHLQYISPSVKKMKGFTVEEALSQSLEEMMTPASLESLMKRFHQEMVLEASGTADPDRTVSFETEEYCKSGATILVENSVTLIRDAQGRPVRMLGISRDITDRRRAEERIRWLASFPELNPNPVIEMDAQGTITFANAATRKTLRDLGLPENPALFVPENKEDLLRLLRETGESRVKREIILNNEIFAEDISLNHELRVVRIYSRNITDRKRAEEALRKSEEKYRGLIEQTGEGVWIIDREYRTTFVNNRLAAMFGYTPQEMTGKQIREFMPAEDMEIHSQRIRERMEGESDRFEQKFFRKDGSVLWTISSVTPLLAEENRLVGAFAMLTDITDRKRMEEQLKRFNEELESQVRSRTDELERLNILLRDEVIQRTGAEERVLKSLKEKDLLLREVHHRVGNNLQIMLSLIRLQSQNIKDPGLLDTMGDFQNRIRAMAQVHERLYRAEDISRINLSEICTFLGTSLLKSFKVDPQHIRLNVEMKDLQVGIDYAIPISLIINELVSNAIKHAFPHGKSGDITIAGHREAGTLVLSVRDTGIGIPEEIDWMRSTQSLGHRLVASLVEQLNGTIELDRTTGTAFNIVVKEKP